MKKILVYILAALPFCAIAQDNFCGTVQTEEDLAWLREWQQNEMATARLGSETIYVPLKIHIVGNDDGGGYLSLNVLMQDICDLNEQFLETGFHFYIYGNINFINNSDYYNHDWTDGALMFYYNNVPDLVNLYFVGDPAGNCGYYSPSGNAMAVANSCAAIGNSTIAHELGHFFSLPHTFYGWEWGTPAIWDQEEVDGDNCNTAADGFCDTPPDYAAYRWNCFGPPTFTDPDGVEFEPDGTYYMSYSNDDCTDKFSPEQQMAMQANIMGPRSNLLDHDPIEVADVDSTVLLTPLDDSEGNYPNYTTLTWQSVENAQGYLVSVAFNIGFTALAASVYTSDTFTILTELTPEKNYFWRVKVIGEGNTCEGHSPYQSFSTGAETLVLSTTEIEGVGTMRFFPNPADAGSQMVIAYDGDDRNWQAGLFDMTGRLLSSSNLVFNGSQALFTLPEVPSGMYMLRVYNGVESTTEAIRVN